MEFSKLKENSFFAFLSVVHIIKRLEVIKTLFALNCEESLCYEEIQKRFKDQCIKYADSLSLSTREEFL